MKRNLWLHECYEKYKNDQDDRNNRGVDSWVGFWVDLYTNSKCYDDVYDAFLKNIKCDKEISENELIAGIKLAKAYKRDIIKDLQFNPVKDTRVEKCWYFNYKKDDKLETCILIDKIEKKLEDMTYYDLVAIDVNNCEKVIVPEFSMIAIKQSIVDNVPVILDRIESDYKKIANKADEEAVFLECCIEVLKNAQKPVVLQNHNLGIKIK